MSQLNATTHPGLAVASATTDARLTFIRRTYAHLIGAILAFTALEVLLFASGLAQPIAVSLSGSWLIVVIAFVGVSWLANWWAMSGASPALQYAGLGIFIVAESIIFLPLIYMAVAYNDGSNSILISAASVTATMCAVATIFVFVTKTDFAFLRWALVLGSIGALIMIVLGLIMGWSMGAWFSGLMILLGMAYLLYETSNVLHRYKTDQYVAASLALFASVMLIFFYVLRLFLGRR
jgi:FtsH-binding integral membrane protein